MKMLIIAASATALMCGAAYAQQSPDTAAPATSAQPAAGDTAATPATPPAGNDMAAPAAPADQSMAAPAAPADQSMAAPAAPADQSMSNGGAMTSPSTTTAGNVQVVASPPVPDTPENRAKYGKPLSNAGKHSKPAGN